MRRKTERRWTVMLVPHGSGASRAVELSQTVVKALVGIGSVIALLFLVLGGAAIARGVSITGLLRRANILVRSVTQAYDSLSSHQARLAATPSIMPTRGWLTSAFMAERVHPILHLARPHEGIDVTAPMGAEIEAPASGIVTDVKWEEGYGNMVTLDHGYGLVTRYAHCSKILVAHAIFAPGARTGGAALRGPVPNVRFRERRGQPARVSRRGRASLYLDDQVRVVLDDVRIWDIRTLDAIPASDILTIEVLTGLDATTYYGGTSTTGAIVIRTKRGTLR